MESDKIQKARERAKMYYQVHRDLVKAKNLARYYERLGKEPKPKHMNLEEKLGLAYLKEQELSETTSSESS